MALVSVSRYVRAEMTPRDYEPPMYDTGYTKSLNVGYILHIAQQQQQPSKKPF